MFDHDLKTPYIPNAAPGPRKHLLKEIGIEEIDALYDAIPAGIKLARPLRLPPPLPSEFSLRQHLEKILAGNISPPELLNFRGAGCWQHFVPAVCDEISSRGEFLTAYGGWPYSDHGKYQALFEYQSMIGELVGMDVVGTPTYDWGSAMNSALLMACRITGRREILVPDLLCPDRYAQLLGFAKPAAEVVQIGHHAQTGLIDLADLERKLSSATGAVYIENPGYLGIVEEQAPQIADMAKKAGAYTVVGVDPISLGLLDAPANYGADLVVGELQPLGIHMYAGGGVAGFIASRDEEPVVMEHPSFLVSISAAKEQGQFGFGVSTMERTSYDKRHDSNDYYGTTQFLWGITAGVYLALIGPQGLAETGTAIMQRSHYAAQKLNAIGGIDTAKLDAPFFKEFVVNFDATGHTVAAINTRLREQGILGGKDLSAEFPSLGQSALYCVTEIHSQADIERLASALGGIVS